MSKINGLLKQEMPREKLIKHGPMTLNEIELLAIILRVGTKEKNVIELSREIISKFTTSIITRKTYDELLEIKGINKAKACQIVAVFELSRRLQTKGIEKKIQIQNSNDVYEITKEDFANLLNEKVIAIFVDTKNKIIKKEFISQGGLNFSIIEPREIIKKVLSLDASGFFLVHNHPSNDLTPSIEDLKITRKIKKICDKLQIRFLDHIIVGDGYYSIFANNFD